MHNGPLASADDKDVTGFLAAFATRCEQFDNPDTVRLGITKLGMLPRVVRIIVLGTILKSLRHAIHVNFIELHGVPKLLVKRIVFEASFFRATYPCLYQYPVW